jgi:curved DNA-binding protein CbpA
MGESFDAYRTLQVDREADPDVIQAAYRRLARKYHPDANPGRDAAERMIAINRAWDFLRDPERRRAYDLTLTSGHPAEASPTPRRGATSGPDAAPASIHRSHEDAAAGTSPSAPSGQPTGSVLGFGRYAGWSIAQIARADLDYLEWLDRMQIGRAYRDEIDAALRRAGRRRTAATSAGEPRGLFRRR